MNVQSQEGCSQGFYLRQSKDPAKARTKETKGSKGNSSQCRTCEILQLSTSYISQTIVSQSMFVFKGMISQNTNSLVEMKLFTCTAFSFYTSGCKGVFIE